MTESKPTAPDDFKPEDTTYESRYTQAYTDAGFWEKLESQALSAGHKAISCALLIYYTLNESHIPRWATVLGLTALGYFILPADAIPDALPAVGYADDLGFLVAAADAISTFTTVEITAKTSEKLSSWFKPEEQNDEA